MLANCEFRVSRLQGLCHYKWTVCIKQHLAVDIRQFAVFYLHKSHCFRRVRLKTDTSFDEFGFESIDWHGLAVRIGVFALIQSDGSKSYRSAVSGSVKTESGDRNHTLVPWGTRARKLPRALFKLLLWDWKRE